MFAKKVMILKSDIQKLNNLICKLEKKQNEISVFVNNNLNFDSTNENLFCLILSNTKKYAISRLEENYNTYICKLKNDFDLNNISLIIFEYENNSLNILALNSQSRLSEIETFIVNERVILLNQVHSLLSIEEEVEKKPIKIENICNEQCNEEVKDICNECFYKKEYFKLTAENQKGTISNLTQNLVKTNEKDFNQEQNATVEKIDEEKELENQVKLDFYRQVEKTITYLFESKPTDHILESYLEESKFVKVEYEETKDYYSVGVIYENQIPKYICYALPCEEGSPPPENLAEFAQYLPIGEKKGYYLMYQDAKTGENIVIQSI